MYVEDDLDDHNRTMRNIKEEQSSKSNRQIFLYKYENTWRFGTNYLDGSCWVFTKQDNFVKGYHFRFLIIMSTSGFIPIKMSYQIQFGTNLVNQSNSILEK